MQQVLITIAHTWAGQPLPADARAHVALTLTSAHGSPTLSVAIDAPYHRDPPPPPGASPRRRYEGLWNYEVVELFIGTRANGHDLATQPYLELEFGPHGHALGLTFSGYRACTGQLDIPGWARIAGDRWRGEAMVPASVLPAGPWDLNAFFIHGTPAARTYGAAWSSPDDQAPDFHHRRTWRPSTLAWSGAR